jgi:lipoyl(octanoyl) transferase
MRPLAVRRLGRIRYADGLALQEALVEQRQSGSIPDTLLLLEHEPVFTLGRNARRDNVLLPEDALRARGFDVIETGRGGDVTYHGPGQLVGYPVMAVTGGVQRFVEALAQAAAAMLAGCGIATRWDAERPGLWTPRGKIAAVGLAIQRGVAMHGIAVNVDPDLSHFQYIVPCGLAGSGVTSVRAELGWSLPVDAAAEALALGFRPPGPPRRVRFLDPEAFFAAVGVSPEE